MAHYHVKDSPDRLRNWLQRARLRAGDFLRLSTTHLLGGAVEVVSEWDCAEGTGEEGCQFLAHDVLDAAQDHCDGLARGRCEYALDLIRREAEGVERVRLTYALRLISASLEGEEAMHPDASAMGQIGQQMRHAEVLMRMAIRAPSLAIDSLQAALRQAHERIATLEAERSASLDREIALLELAAELEQRSRELDERETSSSPMERVLETSLEQLAPMIAPAAMRMLSGGAR